MRWTPDDLVRRLDDVVAVYGEAMNYRADLLEVRRGYIATHVRRPGFRAVATLSREGHLAGFGYGYQGTAGQWWHDQVHRALEPEARQRWLTDCFEVVELHVRPPAQGHGVGARQLRALLTLASGSTTLLSTPEADEQRSRAWRLYRRFGFADVLRDFRFPGDERPFGVLGRDLPLPAPTGSAPADAAAVAPTDAAAVDAAAVGSAAVGSAAVGSAAVDAAVAGSVPAESTPAESRTGGVGRGPSVTP